MKNYPKTEEERLERNEYFRKYTKANRKRIAEINQRYWANKIKELNSQ